jgi:hypothetical protein
VLPRHDVACVVHLHSVHSDGTGTVAEIAAAAQRAAADVVLLTDHDSLEARRCGEEGWHGDALVCVGEEVSPKGGNHYLAFGVEQEIVHAGLSPAQIVAAVRDAGGFGFIAHPWSKGSELFPRVGKPMPWSDLDADGYTGLEVWSFVTDTSEYLRSWGEVARFVTSPLRVVERPPALNLADWDRLGARRPVVGIAGLDAHQVGKRIAGRVPIRLMGYARSFRQLRTHCLLDRPFTGESAADRDAVYTALRTGRCYMALDALAPAGGFAFWGDGVPMGEEAAFAEGAELHVRVPRPAQITLLRDGAPVAQAHGPALDHRAEGPGVWRAEATLPAHGRERAWILSNPVYLR